MNKEQLDKLNIKYDSLQNKYGDSNLNSVYNGGCIINPDVCFVFMNPTRRNIASYKSWEGPRYPWIGIKNIWKLFYSTNLISKDIYDQINNKSPKDWTYEFTDKVYEDVINHKFFITNLGKCTQLDARPLKDEVLAKYLKLLLKEIEIIKPKLIITFGNQVSSIILDKKITVSTCRKQFYEKKINNDTYKFFPVYYPIGNGIFNIDKAIEDINWIINNNI